MESLQTCLGYLYARNALVLEIQTTKKRDKFREGRFCSKYAAFSPMCFERQGKVGR